MNSFKKGILLEEIGPEFRSIQKILMLRMVFHQPHQSIPAVIAQSGLVQKSSFCIKTYFHCRNLSSLYG